MDPIQQIHNQVRKVEEVLDGIRQRHPKYVTSAIVVTAQISMLSTLLADLARRDASSHINSVVQTVHKEIISNSIEILGIALFGDRDPQQPLTPEETERFQTIQKEVILLIDYMKGLK